MRCRPPPSDRGSASIWVVTGAVLVLTVALAMTIRTGAVSARHRAESAADLAALAAAAGIGVDVTSGGSCARAEHIARANEARLTLCTLTLDASGRSGQVQVRVEVEATLAILGRRTVGATARAARLPAGPEDVTSDEPASTGRPRLARPVNPSSPRHLEAQPGLKVTTDTKSRRSGGSERGLGHI